MTGWTMKQIFSGKVPQTNEEFVQYLKKRSSSAASAGAERRLGNRTPRTLSVG